MNRRLICLLSGISGVAMAVFAIWLGWRATALGGGGPIGPATTADQQTARRYIMISMLAGMAAWALLMGFAYWLEKGPRFWPRLVATGALAWIALAGLAAWGLAVPVSPAARAIWWQAMIAIILSPTTAALAAMMPHRRVVPSAADIADLKAAVTVLDVIAGTRSKVEDFERSYGNNLFLLLAICGSGVMVLIYLAAFPDHSTSSHAAGPTIILLVGALIHVAFIGWAYARYRTTRVTLSGAGLGD